MRGGQVAGLAGVGLAAIPGGGGGAQEVGPGGEQEEPPPLGRDEGLDAAEAGVLRGVGGRWCLGGGRFGVRRLGLRGPRAGGRPGSRGGPATRGTRRYARQSCPCRPRSESSLPSLRFCLRSHQTTGKTGTGHRLFRLACLVPAARFNMVRRSHGHHPAVAVSDRPHRRCRAPGPLLPCGHPFAGRHKAGATPVALSNQHHPLQYRAPSPRRR